ncbi:MAG TPA: MarR family transcriptional regulator [Clostridium sp.]|nr:MarR family transcriptional regulator [Clostridium sp.]
MPEDIQPQVGILIKNISNIVSTELNNNLKPYNITGVQARALFYINCASEKGNVFQKDIQNHLKLANPTVTGIVQRLEEKQLIERSISNQDCRYKCHVLTDKGRDFIKSLSNYSMTVMEQRILNGFSKEETETLTSLLLKILKNLGK